jgi:formylmethanofuran dehydrogenase subunit E-like metal-binding protein
MSQMKKVIIVFAVSLFVVGCGPNAEEQAAIDSLNSQLSSLKVSLEQAKFEEKFWADSMNEKTSNEMIIVYGEKWQKALAEVKSLETEITDVQFKIAQVY